MRAISGPALALVVVALPAMADPPGQTRPQDRILSYYPKAALDHGVSGYAVLGCGRTEHGGFTGCRVLRESPGGQGFGDAAMALVGKAVECPSLEVSAKDRASLPYYFGFSAKPQFVTPNVLSPEWPIIQGTSRHRPNSGNMASVYPPDAMREGRSGASTLVCAVDKTGRVQDCEVAGEDPPGYGFGQAVLALASFFEFTPSLDCAGAPVEGSVVIPVGFTARH